MGVSFDDKGRRFVAVETAVPGTVEQAWNAIATGPGVSAWFVPTEFRADGTVISDFGPGMESVSTITLFEPNRRFRATSADLGPVAPPIETEWSVATRPDGAVVVRVEHAIATDKTYWDGSLAAWEGGWPDFFRLLRLYLAHFAGQASAGIQATGFADAPESEAWAYYAGALGLSGAKAGERRAALPDVPAFAGVVEEASAGDGQHQAIIRLERPAPGLAHLFAMPMEGSILLSFRCYLYGGEASEIAAREQPRWKSWMEERFPAPPVEE